MFDETKRCFAQAKNLKAKVTLKVASLGSADGASTVLGVMPGTFYDTVMPETSESMWGPVPMTKLPQGKINDCKAVVNR